MFDAIAPRYDLVNRVMTLRLDVRWRRRAVRTRPAGRQPSSTWPAAPATCVSTSPGRAAAAVRRPQPRHVRADHSGAPAAGRHPPAPAPRPRRSADGVTCGFACATSWTWLRSSTSSGGSFVQVATSPCSTSAIPQNRLVRRGHGIYFGKSCRRIGAVLSDPAAYRYLPRSVAYLPPPEAMLTMLPAGRVRRRDPPRALPAGSPSCSWGLGPGRRPDGEPDACGHPLRRRHDRGTRSQRHRPVRTGSCSSATASGSPAAASRCASGDRDHRRGVGLHRSRRYVPAAHVTPVAIGWVPFDPTAVARSSSRPSRCARLADGRRGHDDRRRRSSTSPAPQAPSPVTRRTPSLRSPLSTNTSPRSPPLARRPRATAG